MADPIIPQATDQAALDARDAARWREFVARASFESVGFNNSAKESWRVWVDLPSAWMSFTEALDEAIVRQGHRLASDGLRSAIVAAERRGMVRAAEIAEPSDPACQCEGCRRARQIVDAIHANAGTDTEPPPMTVHDAAEVLRSEGWTVSPPRSAAHG